MSSADPAFSSLERRLARIAESLDSVEALLRSVAPTAAISATHAELLGSFKALCLRAADDPSGALSVVDILEMRTRTLDSRASRYAGSVRAVERARALIRSARERATAMGGATPGHFEARVASCEAEVAKAARQVAAGRPATPGPEGILYSARGLHEQLTEADVHTRYAASIGALRVSLEEALTAEAADGASAEAQSGAREAYAGALARVEALGPKTKDGPVPTLARRALRMVRERLARRDYGGAEAVARRVDALIAMHLERASARDAEIAQLRDSIPTREP